MRQIVAFLLLSVAINANAQNDTLHIATDKRDDVVYSRFYVINDSKFMTVHYNAEKNDTLYEESIPEYYVVVLEVAFEKRMVAVKSSYDFFCVSLPVSLYTFFFHYLKQ